MTHIRIKWTKRSIMDTIHKEKDIRWKKGLKSVCVGGFKIISEQNNWRVNSLGSGYKLRIMYY